MMLHVPPDVRRSIATLIVAIGVGAGLGSGLAVLPTGVSTAVARDCNGQACDVDYKYCFGTDVQSHCVAAGGGCSSEMCTTFPVKDGCEFEACDPSPEAGVCVRTDIPTNCSDQKKDGGGYECSGSPCEGGW